MLRMSRRAPVVRVAGAAAVGHQMGAKSAQQQQAAAQQATGQEQDAVLRQQADLVQPAQQRSEQKAPPVVAPVDDTVEQLMKLTQLHDAGAISDEEFRAAKARIVG